MPPEKVPKLIAKMAAAETEQNNPISTTSNPNNSASFDELSVDDFWDDSSFSSSATTDQNKMSPYEMIQRLQANENKLSSQDELYNVGNVPSDSSFNAGTSPVTLSNNTRNENNEGSSSEKQIITSSTNNTGSSGGISKEDKSDKEFNVLHYWSFESGEDFKSILREGVDIAGAMLMENDGELGVSIEELTIILSQSEHSEEDDGGELLVYFRSSVEVFFDQSTTSNEDKDTHVIEQPEPIRVYKLNDILFILNGKQTPTFEPFIEEQTLSAKAEEDVGVHGDGLMDNSVCCSLVGVDFSFDLIASSQEERDALSFGFAAFLGFRYLIGLKNTLYTLYLLQHTSQLTHALPFSSSSSFSFY